MVDKDKTGLTLEEIEYLKILMNPVSWAEATLRDPRPGKESQKLKLRDYQKEILLDPANQKVIRAGRRLGKTATMVVNMLHFAQTNPETIQIFATPYDNQAKLIYDELMKYINASPDLAASLKRSVKSPYEVEFRNGAKIKGFTAGTRSGAEGGSLRGQAAQFLYLDELDYMTEADFETIYAIALADPKNIKVWCSSTPTGKRSTFWKLCTGAIPGWKEFYYPIMRNPEWSPEMEAQLRGQYSEQGYIHECLAEFGEETVGVFAKELIDTAKSKYEYGAHNKSFGLPCFITVDWDKYGAETTILVSGWTLIVDSKGNTCNKLRVFDKVLIPKSQFTFDNAVKKIIELNNEYDPDYIYVDRGSGEYQVETLHQYGINHPDSGLRNKVVGISLGSSRKVLDPATGTMEKKPLKSFMVNQLSILFERHQIMINENDEALIKQLENYRVVKTSRDGVPIYSDEDEHGVDCLGFAVLAMLDNFPDLLKTIQTYKAVNDLSKLTMKQIDVLTMTEEEDSDYMDEKDVFTEKTPLVKVPIGTKSYKEVEKRHSIMAGWGQRNSVYSRPFERKGW